MRYVNRIAFLTGYLFSLAYDDLSDNKIANQSSTFPGTYDWYKAGNALDRDITTCTRTEAIGGTSRYQTVWWTVDLGVVYNIYSVIILFKNYDGHEIRQRGRIAGLSLYISDTGNMNDSSLCYKDGPKLPPLNFTTTCITSGRYVTFYNERLNSITYPEGYEISNVFMELCEVFILGCSNGALYGSNCEFPCPINCRYNTCEIQNGTCYECKPGWTGKTCNKKCAIGWQGLDCKERCSVHCRNNSLCNHVTGQCEGGCEAGWNGTTCDKVCDDGFYGNNCVHYCSGHCLNDTPCNKMTGHCNTGCIPGYKMCTARNVCCFDQPCTHGYYGTNCKYQCSQNCLSNAVCDHIHGVCTDGCQNGYIGKLCNATCTDGYYGYNCSEECYPNCKTCRHTDGKCTCLAGWMGVNCSTGCVQSYGENCIYPCNQHCINNTCNRFDGSCLLGCEDGYNGDRCEQGDLLNPSKNQQWNKYIVGLSISLGFNALSMAIISILLWRLYTLTHPEGIHPCRKPSTYVKSKEAGGEESTYQEIHLQENPYLNTSLQ